MKKYIEIYKNNGGPGLTIGLLLGMYLEYSIPALIFGLSVGAGLMYYLSQKTKKKKTIS